MKKEELTGYPSIDKPWLKYYSEEAINAALPECTMYKYLWENNKDHLGDIALDYFGKETTYGQLFEHIDEAARAFACVGVRQGDIVTICTVTTPETIYAFYALNKLGAISNMVDPRTNAEAIKHYLNETNTTILLILEAAYPKIERMIADTIVEKIIAVSAADSMPPIIKLGYKLTEGRKAPVIPKGGRYMRWREFMVAGRGAHAEQPAYMKDMPAVIIHTGGTTGTPKGVVLSNDNFNIMVILQKHSRTRMERGHRFLDIMPPFIAYGLVCGIHNPLCLGMQVIAIPKFSPSEFASLIVKHKPNHALGVPSFWEDLTKSSRLAGRDLSFIQNAITGGDRILPATEEVINTFFQEHGCEHRLSKGYGMTELSSTATYSVCDDCNPPESAGIPLFLNNVRIVEPGTQKELRYNEQGEICLTSPTMMLGYYRDVAETKRVMQTHEDGQVWMHSSDIGYMDENGVLFLVDRLKRMIVRHDGFKVYPSIIEIVISRHEAVSACAVVGMPDPGYSQGMVPKACIVLKPTVAGQEQPVREEIQALCKKELAEYAQPEAFAFRDSLPLTPVGKVDYRALEQETTA